MFDTLGNNKNDDKSEQKYDIFDQNIYSDKSQRDIKPPISSANESNEYGVVSKFSAILSLKFSNISLTSDLSQNIGSAAWFRALAIFLLLLVATLFFIPSFGPLYGAQQPLQEKAEFEQSRAQMIMPLAYGGDTGTRMAASPSVLRLKDSPERPSIELTATMGQGDSFNRVLRRAGIGSNEAANISQLVSAATPLSSIAPGTPINIILGRRSAKNSTRPVENLSFRARFDLGLSVERIGNALALKREVIQVDETPLRIRGRAGNSLYRSARAAGVDADIAQQFLKIISQQLALSKIRSSDEFDIIIEHKRAETGEVETGGLLYAGIENSGKPRVQMLKWQQGSDSQWFEASGVGETKGVLSRPVPGPVSSGFGMRRHPVLGYRRMHNGLDFKASYGTPIRAASDGRVTYSGRNGGAGNFVKIKHNKELATGYAHMSRIAVSNGNYVRRGQIIGYVGSTGLSTGPHLHYVLYRNGRPINPASVKFTETAQLAGRDLIEFKAKLARLKSVKPGEALAPLQRTNVDVKPDREIEKLSKASTIEARKELKTGFNNSAVFPTSLNKQKNKPL